jgi:murein L,D-transpeptidase YafK
MVAIDMGRLIRWTIVGCLAGSPCAWAAEKKVTMCVNTVEELNLLPGMDPADPRLKSAHLIVVHKKARKIQRFTKGHVATTDKVASQASCWSIGLGPAPVGHKYREGDGRTPEGWYTTSDKSWSQFYGAIAVHYPNEQDAEAGQVQGRIDTAVARTINSALGKKQKPPQNTPLGGEILIHGGGGTSDWTLGCVAMDNPAIDALRAGMPSGKKTHVLILP